MSSDHGADSATVETEDQLRADVYRLLANLMTRPPTRETLNVLADIQVDDAQAGDAITRAWSQLREAATQCEPAPIDDEFHTLFIGLGRGEVVPFGSWYLTGLLMEKPLSALRADLDRFGIERADGVRESEDHIAALCEAMAAIIEHPLEIDREAQVEFFRSHLQPWVLRFFEDVENAQAAGFYRCVARLGNAFFRLEREYAAMEI